MFPLSTFPNDTDRAPGLIVADAFGAEIIRAAPRFDLPPARRKAVTLSFARYAALRASRV
ncbi:MAG: MmcB family DNA repair protein [Hyphomonadaceae bacterium]|nr:MmcB family DNA repair protein [Hyphomonadaceae bacterium]